ncbi:hypothetical protein L484_012009 [Morus notabilis]|uniref:Amino acid transporter transmembrane domain-containing protein n=1 Tax=Morus notabilis TaxID=981085 RepID=W9RVA1_9ROSA|nr:amino acid transporter AVT1H [Morus notabilis]EXB97441.1 hypothetical protein L484_012009 [Morus notabilis]
MWSKILKFFGKSECSNCLAHQNQVASESVHGAELDAKQMLWARCDVCVEQNQVCKCDQSADDQHLKSVTDVGHNHDGDHQANSSFAHAVINMIGMLIGLGQLSTPYALENGGWSSVFLLIGLGLICTYSTLLLGKCLDKNANSKSYTDIGHQAFGNKGKIILATFIYLEIFMTLVSYTISLHDNIIVAFSGVKLNLPWAKLSTSQLLTILAVLVAVPSLWLRNLSSISFLSFGGILMSAVIFSSVACTAIFGGVKADHKIPALQLHKIPAISGLYIFSYAGHIVFPNLYVTMKDPSKFKKGTIVSFTLVTTLYTILAFMGAKLFGPQVNPQITLSMPPHFIATKIALWATVLTPMTKYALEFSPLALQLEHNYFPSKISPKTKTILRGLVGSFLLLLILALALSVPYFEHVLGLTGSLLSAGVCIIFPCALYTKICWAEISRPVLAMNLVLIGFGALLGVLGTVSSSKMLIESLKGT